LTRTTPFSRGSAVPELDFSRDLLTISRLNRMIAGLLERSLSIVWVSGEISNFTRAASGHWYFTLKDDAAQARAVMFRGRAQQAGFMPREGDRVEVRALATLYEPRGDFQLNVELIRRAGAGDLHQRFLQLKARLQQEGLFDADRKRLLPRLPARIGVITSLHAAALQDVLSTLARRAPQIPIVVYPAPVQGADAPAALIAALRRAAARAECEVLLLVRGGGSIEDLWAFNDEALARAISDSPIPLICGVGHESDFTIADFVADQRAPTPTGAAEMAAPERRELLEQLDQAVFGMRRAFGRILERASQRVDLPVRLLRPPSVQWRERAQRLSVLRNRLASLQAMRLERAGQRLLRARDRLRPPDPSRQAQAVEALVQRLAKAFERGQERRFAQASRLDGALALVSPLAVLERGYAIVLDQAGRVIRASEGLAAGQGLQVQFARGEIGVRVESIQDEDSPGHQHGPR
jgi:exodeoxyribonuclease VII large subunit